MRVSGLVLTRHGTNRVPFSLQNTQDPAIRAFVTVIQQITRLNNPHPPREVHFLLLHGILGLSVNIEGWGNRRLGFFKYLLDRDAATETTTSKRTPFSLS